MKKLFVIALVAIAFAQCKKDNTNVTPAAPAIVQSSANSCDSLTSLKGLWKADSLKYITFTNSVKTKDSTFYYAQKDSLLFMASCDFYCNGDIGEIKYASGGNNVDSTAFGYYKNGYNYAFCIAYKNKIYFSSSANLKDTTETILDIFSHTSTKLVSIVHVRAIDSGTTPPTVIDEYAYRYYTKKQ